MSVTVSVPTVLRPHTGGAKRVQATGSTVAEVIDDLDANYAGLKDRLVQDGKLLRFVNVYVSQDGVDEDIRFSGGLATVVADGATVTILPAVAGGDRSHTVAGG
ncbi:MoaD/ThiS family protein [Skermania piniformis]|uniref:MoaD/ThiS family protein n=1 Tax=Skermania pinensis TaxID=39122 RepID=A0ABX8SA94_9ACTN|nr:MoaD/ThiS family protein [Skermania piniformis]QXQ14784.1 MoaD/ThiS family protein [Skermania piniformis]